MGSTYSNKGIYERPTANTDWKEGYMTSLSTLFNIVLEELPKKQEIQL